MIELPPGSKTETVKKLAAALDNVTGKRPVDNRMRIEFLRALGELNDPAAAEVLTKVMLRQSEEQNFLINNLAVEQIGRLAEPSTVPALMEALYLFDPTNPGNRLTQTVPAALVQIGKPALPPLLKVVRGEDEKALAQTKAWIEAVRQRAPQAAEQMVAQAEMKKEAIFALGTLGFPEAIDPLIAAASDADKGVQLGAAVALAQINRADSDSERIRNVVIKVYDSQEKIQRMQALRAMQHLYDPGAQPFFLKVAKTPEEELPDLRVIALNAYAMLANKAEAAQAKALISSDTSPYKETFEQQNNTLLAAAEVCDQDLGLLDQEARRQGRERGAQGRLHARAPWTRTARGFDGADQQDRPPEGNGARRRAECARLRGGQRFAQKAWRRSNSCARPKRAVPAGTT